MEKKPSRSTKWDPLEFRIYRRVQKLIEQGASFSEKKILIACSGGADSIALVHVLEKLAPRFGSSIAVAHVHHGSSADPHINAARDRARNRVKRLARDLRLEFFVNDSKEFERRADEAKRPELRSEESLRDFRYSHLEAWCRRSGFDFLALAHHADDLLETRLIRLIRGTGPQGLSAMQELSGHVLRPLLGENRADLEAYLEKKSVRWVNDPSNSQVEPLRNWVRHRWLPALEKKREGAVDALARSLDLIVEALDEQSNARPDGCVEADGVSFIDRKIYRQLGESKQREILAYYLRALGVRNFGASHVAEIRKRLDVSKKVLTFELLKLTWEINAERIQAQRMTRDVRGG